MRIPLYADMNINEFTGASVTELGSGITNGVVEKRDDRTFITQRPSIDVFEDASDHISDSRGRAIFYWEETDTIYIVNDNGLYKGTQGTSISTGLTTGTERCYFDVIGTTLLLINTEGDEAFTINSSDTVTEVTDVNFPPKQTPALSLAHGAVVINSTLFVMTTTGLIHNSNVGDATTWGALDFVEAERKQDGGVYLGYHHDMVVAYGATTIEFFYYTENTVGSPLTRRQDVSFNIGCSSGLSVWEDEDVSFFVGTSNSGALGVYMLKNFSYQKISTSSLDVLLAQAVLKNNYLAIGSGYTARGHIFYVLTLAELTPDVNPITSFCYDAATGIWSPDWSTTVNGLSNYPLVGWSKRSGRIERYGEGILTNGDLITINDKLIPIDTYKGGEYVTSGYVASGYVASTSNFGVNVSLKSRTGMKDFGTKKYKIPNKIDFIADTTDNTQTLTLKWANENSATFNTGRTLDMSLFKPMTRNGRFRRRNFEVSYSGDEQIRLEALELDLNVSDT